MDYDGTLPKFVKSLTAAHGQPLGRADERFSVIRELGRGGMGVVLLVEDRLRGQQLALKRVRHADGLDERRLKREFRVIESIVHPNIVSVLELGVDDLGPYFLMEPVRGASLTSWCRQGTAEAEAEPEQAPRARCSEASSQRPFLSSGEQPLGPTATFTFEATTELALSRPARGVPAAPLDQPGFQRLFAALPQLLAALACLHEKRLVHRDLKPSNVLVRADGVLKLLDFGILGEIGAAYTGSVAGTAAYMAPEQIGGALPSPANDLYALGVMLFEIVTGHLPFAGATREDVLFQHLHATPLPISMLAPACPEWIQALIARLMQKSPDQRGTLAALIDLCSVRQSPARGGDDVVVPELVERAEEQALLEDVLDARGAQAFRFAVITGATGLGKSSLLDWARARAEERRLAVLSSRTRFSERVPFNAIDGIVDDLAALLERLPGLTDDSQGSLLRQRAAAAFPVLRRSRHVLAGAHPTDAFDALAVLLQRCARALGTLVLLSDDLQWADGDSVRVLERLVRAAPDGVVWIATVRDDTHTPAFERFWAEFQPHARIPLEPLPLRALSHIVEQVATEAGHPLTHADAERAAAACAGSPLLAVVSGRVAARAEVTEAKSPIAWLLAGYAGHGSSERRVLALLAALDGRAVLHELACALGVSSGAIEGLLSPLVCERLMLATGNFGRDRAYDFSHDLVRSQALLLLEQHELRTAHAQIADHVAFGSERGAALVRHLLGAERWEQAGRAAVTAARDAERSNAFGLAAELYEIAIQRGRAPNTALRTARARSLERSGRYVDAAAEWRTVAESQQGQARVDALLQQAKALLATEHIREGREVLRVAQREQAQGSWVPERAANLVTALRFMLGPRALPGPARLPRRDPRDTSGDRDVFLGTVIGFNNPLAGVRHMLRTRRLYRSAGNEVQAAELEYVLAYVALWGSMRQGATALGEKYANNARRTLGGRVTPEHGRPYAQDCMIRGVCAMHVGAWDRARTAIDESIATLERIGYKRSFEHLFCWVQRQYVDRFSQDVHTWGATLDALQRLTDEGQDSVLRCELAFGRTRHALWIGDIEGARRLGRKAREAWPDDATSYQSYVLDFYQLAADMYDSDALELRVRAHHILRKYSRLRPASGMFGVDTLSHLALLEAAALLRGGSDASFRRIVKWARRAERACPLGRHMALRAVAYALDYTGQPERALAQLACAERRAVEVNQPVDVAIARYQRGIRLRGSSGQSLIADAERLMQRAGAHTVLLHEDPARR